MNFDAHLPDQDLLQLKQVYLVGIKGVGMTALAQLLSEWGLRVMGADVDQDFVTADTLQKIGVFPETFANAQIPADMDLVIYSGAHGGSEHSLVLAAQEQKIPVISLAQAVGLLSRQKKTIAVCGVGGKSSTTALLSWMLSKAGLKPSYAVGVGSIPNLGQSAHWESKGQHFVVEADEYVADPKQDQTPRFMYLQPKHIICTSLTYDHPDVYANKADTDRAFLTFFNKLDTSSFLVVNGDDQDLLQLAKQSPAQIISVGEKAHNQVRVSVSPIDGNGSHINLLSSQWGEENLKLSIPGYHNAYNAAYAYVLARLLGAESKSLQAALVRWRSVQRRWEFVGETMSGIQIYDDYAHHPREIAAVAQTLQKWFAGRSTVVAFEPHTYSRTKALADDFVKALTSIPGEIVLLPIFASAREVKDEGISSQILVDKLRAVGHNARYVEDYQQLLQYIKNLPAGTLVLTLGAGDIYHTFDHVDLYHTTN